MAEWTHLCAQAQRNLLIPVGEPCDRCGMPWPEPGIKFPEPTVEDLRAMYDAQCACTDEWARKYHALRSKKSDEALTARIVELEGQLAAVNRRLIQAQGGIVTLGGGYPGDHNGTKAAAASGLRSLKVLLGTDSPEVRGWVPAVQQAAQRAINAAIVALHPDGVKGERND